MRPLGCVITWTRIQLVAVAALAAGVLLSSCAGGYSGPRNVEGQNDPSARRASCSALVHTVLSRERAGQTGGVINAELDELGKRCPGKYQTFVDYVSFKSLARADAKVSCSKDAIPNVKLRAVEWARQDGLCAMSVPTRRPLPPPTVTWSCGYSPTYNRDWHDDIVCSNGAEQTRPYLRGWDDFVTESEIMESAREYELELNSQ